jgi:hypothetical protein
MAKPSKPDTTASLACESACCCSPSRAGQIGSERPTPCETTALIVRGLIGTATVELALNWPLIFFLVYQRPAEGDYRYPPGSHEEGSALLEPLPQGFHETFVPPTAFQLRGSLCIG